jgi:hypothetical protein
MRPGIVGPGTTMTTPLRWAALFSSSFLCWGCSGDDKTSGVAESKLPEGTNVSVKHEDCPESGNRVEVLDSNKDGKADIKRVFDKSSGREICHVADLNHDGKPELYEYFDASGQIRRRELVYDDSGVVSSIELYENGKIVRREMDTSGQHRIDTVDTFDPSSGKRIKRERDSNGDGIIDQWWTYTDDRIEIVMDKNYDGKPDPEATITLGSNGQPIVDSGVGAEAGAVEGGSVGAPPPPPAPVLFAEPPADAGTARDAGKAGKPKTDGGKGK